MFREFIIAPSWLFNNEKNSTSRREIYIFIKVNSLRIAASHKEFIYRVYTSSLIEIFMIEERIELTMGILGIFNSQARI